jgi:single-stranded DNA-binding protein
VHIKGRRDGDAQNQGDGSQFWRVVASSESAQAELIRLTDGDELDVQGALTVKAYSKDGGETKLSLSVIADHVLALREPPRRKPIDGKGRLVQRQAPARAQPARAAFKTPSRSNSARVL